METYNKKTLTNLYETMLRIRHSEESFVDLIKNGTIKCPVHMYVGEEAIATGVCANLDKKDVVFGTHRSHGHYIAKGGNMKEMIAEIYGKETGCAKGRGGSMHVIDVSKGMLGAAPIVAGTVSLASGAALVFKIRKEKRVAVTFFGDGAIGEGVLHETLNFSALHKLPVLFVCENNFYSTHMPIKDTRPKNNIYEVGAPHGIYYRRCEGNDVLKVYECAKQAIKHIKSGKGPAFLEFLTYRYRGHVGPDDNIQGSSTDIRPKSEITKWKKNDPIKNMERFLLKKKIMKERDLGVIIKKVGKEIEAAHLFAEKSPYPKEKELKKYVFKK